MGICTFNSYKQFRIVIIKKKRLALFVDFNALLLLTSMAINYFIEAACWWISVAKVMWNGKRRSGLVSQIVFIVRGLMYLENVMSGYMHTRCLLNGSNDKGWWKVKTNIFLIQYHFPRRNGGSRQGKSDKNSDESLLEWRTQCARLTAANISHYQKLFPIWDSLFGWLFLPVLGLFVRFVLSVVVGLCY